eukprot:jgi/Astpho2/2308/Aster-x1064
MTGGGEAGGSKRGSQVNYVRQTPKFLQAHAHLLGRGGQPPAPGAEGAPEGATIAALEDEPPEDDWDDDGGALQRAIAEQPDLVVGAPELQQLANKASTPATGKAAEIKVKGNAAFKAKLYGEAIKHFTECIKLDPRCEVYYSNRSAAHAAIQQWREALEDAQACTRLKPRWGKGWSRRGAAQSGLELHGEARESYEKALQLEPDNQDYLAALQRADQMERKQADQHQHKFRRRDDRLLDKLPPRNIKGKPASGSHAKSRRPMSFEDDEGD